MSPIQKRTYLMERRQIPGQEVRTQSVELQEVYFSILVQCLKNDSKYYFRRCIKKPKQSWSLTFPRKVISCAD